MTIAFLNIEFTGKKSVWINNKLKYFNGMAATLLEIKFTEFYNRESSSFRKEMFVEKNGFRKAF